jgi:redox-sensing transcriptional repressor
MAPREGPVVGGRRIPEATVARLPRYLQALVEAAEAGTLTLSSDDLAQAAGLNSAKVRKDLSFLGTYGTRGVGYNVAELTTEISGVLGITADRAVVIVGVGNLGSALASYRGFDRRGFKVVALLDADPSRIGAKVGSHIVDDVASLSRIVEEHDVTFVVIAVPAEHAQAVADEAIAAGVTALLNFAPTHLTVPDHVTCRTVDLSTELQILSFYQQIGDGPSAAAAG